MYTPRSTVDSSSFYFQELKKKPPLEPEQEHQWALASRKGDQAASRHMVESNLRLVVKLAFEYLRPGVALLDLIEEGNLGLIHALRKFEPERGHRFSTYAVWWIHQYMARFLMNHGRTVRIPEYLLKRISVVHRQEKGLAHKLNRKPSELELAEHTLCTPDKIRYLQGICEGFCTGEKELAQIPVESVLLETVEQEELHQHILKALTHLGEMEQEVMVRRFGLLGDEPQTLEQIGVDQGYSRERIRQIQQEALRKLRGYLESVGLNGNNLFH